MTSTILTSCQTHSVQFIAMFRTHKLFCLATLAVQTRSAPNVALRSARKRGYRMFLGPSGLALNFSVPHNRVSPRQPGHVTLLSVTYSICQKRSPASSQSWSIQAPDQVFRCIPRGNVCPARYLSINYPNFSPRFTL